MKSKILSLFCFLFICLPVVVFGYDETPGDTVTSVTQPNTAVPAFQSLVGIPGIPDISIPSLQFGDYINALYKLAISIAALFAVFKIVIAGVRYMLDDIVTHKQEAKSDIRGALVGLLVILAAYIILNTINTDITKNQIAIVAVDANSAPAWQDALTAAMQEAANTCVTAGPNCTIISFPMGSTAGDDKEICDYRGGYFYSGSTFAVSMIVGTDYWPNCTYDIAKAQQKLDEAAVSSCPSDARTLGCSAHFCDHQETKIGDTCSYQCTSDGGTWVATGVCVTPTTVSDIDILEQNCSNAGKLWDASSRTCGDYPSNSLPPPIAVPTEVLNLDKADLTAEDIAAANTACSDAYNTSHPTTGHWIYNPDIKRCQSVPN